MRNIQRNEFLETSVFIQFLLAVDMVLCFQSQRVDFTKAFAGIHKLRAVELY